MGGNTSGQNNGDQKAPVGPTPRLAGAPSAAPQSVMHTDVRHGRPALSDVGAQLGELRLGHGLVGFVLQTRHLPAVKLILAGGTCETRHATEEEVFTLLSAKSAYRPIQKGPMKTEMAPQEALPTASTTSCTDSQSRLSRKTSLRSSERLIPESRTQTFQ